MHFDGGCSPGGEAGSDGSGENGRENGAPCDGAVLGVKQHGSCGGREKIKQVDTLCNSLIHGHDSRHPDHQDAAASNAETGENSTDQAGGAGN